MMYLIEDYWRYKLIYPKRCNKVADIERIFKEIGRKVTIYEPVTIIKPEAVILKNNIIISEYCYLYAGLGLYIGNGIHISAFCSILGGGFCVIDDFVGICAGTRIITGSEDVMGRGLTGGPAIPERFRAYYRSFVICEKHSFIGTNSVIHPGITIGEGAVVGSGSIVTKDLEPWGIYVGNPARRIKERPKDKILKMERDYFSESSDKPSDFSKLKKRIRQTTNQDPVKN